MLPDPRRFDSQDYGRVVNLRTQTIDLSTARDQSTPFEWEGAGSFLWLTDDSTGSVHLRLNSNKGDRIPAAAGFFMEAIDGAAITRSFFDWTAQSGKQIVIAWGEGVRFKPSNDIQNIGSITNEVTIQKHQAAEASWVDKTNTATLQTIVTPAANSNGLTVVELSIGSTVTKGRFMHKSSAPSAWDDTDAMTLQVNDPSIGIVSQGAFPLFIPAGQGLYFQNKNADTGVRSAAYTVH